MTISFRDAVRRALADPALQQALDRNAERRRAAWGPAFASLPDAAAVRRRAARIRRRTVGELQTQLAGFTDQLQRRGVFVHRAATANDACAAVLGILRERGVQRVIKAKSMVTEEIGLNRALGSAGISVVETDLGEFIVQLRGERPAHITTPAIHLRREDVARTFVQHLGMPFTTDVEAMTSAAREALRSRFLQAEAGISGVNFGVVETGTLCLVTNEGNGRMVTTLPPLHIAVMGVERLVPTLTDLSVMLDLLPRAGTGQARTSYVSLLQGPRGDRDPDGPSERHVVLVDNGRMAMLSSPLAEGLACIRCGACLNACPIFQEIGGHAYGSAYPGPIGSVISPGLWDYAAFGHLATASTLCGACRDACPVEIDLPALLLRARAERADQGGATLWLRAGMRLFAWVIARPGRYAGALRLAAAGSRLAPRRAGWLRWLPPPLGAWTAGRDFPSFNRRPFRDRWGHLASETVASQVVSAERLAKPPLEAGPRLSAAVPQRFDLAAQDAGCEVVACSRASLPEEIAGFLRREHVNDLLCWKEDSPEWARLANRLQGDGVRLVVPELPDDDPAAREQRLAEYAAAPAGLTGAVAGLADAGSLVVASGAGRSQLASLLPPLHLAVLHAADIHPSLESWLDGVGRAWVSSESGVVLISGPSRTADIEMTLTIGVHGPGRVVLFLVRD